MMTYPHIIAGQGGIRAKITPMLPWVQVAGGRFSQKWPWDVNLSQTDLSAAMNRNDVDFVFDKSDFSKSAYAK